MKKQNKQVEIEFFNKLAEANEDYDTISENVYELILNKISPYFGDNLLEAGCGSGAFGLRIKSKKKETKIVGVDLNQKLVNLALKNEIYSKLICADIENKNLFKKSQFDTIICPYLLHHFPDIQEVVDNCYYWLKPKGHLIVIDPNGSNLILKISYLLRKFIISKITNTKKYASGNESHKSVPFFLKSLKKFEICSIETFEHKTKISLKLFPLTFIKTLAIIQKFLLKIYKNLFFIKFRGSDLIIISKKK